MKVPFQQPFQQYFSLIIPENAVKGVWNSISHYDHHSYIHNFMNCIYDVVYRLGRVKHNHSHHNPIEFPTSKPAPIRTTEPFQRHTAGTRDVTPIIPHPFQRPCCEFMRFFVPRIYLYFAMASSSLVVSASTKVSTPFCSLFLASSYLGIQPGFGNIGI